jgi:hypothetical protein
METTIITEFVQFEAQESTTDEQILSAVHRLNQFQKEYEGFLDSEIAKDIKEESWHIIFHYENFESLKTIGAHLRSSKEFMDFNSLVVSESLQISFSQQLKNW